MQSGTSLQELMELGGWRSYEMVLRYAHLAPEKLKFVASRIERQPEAASLKVAPRGRGNPQQVCEGFLNATRRRRAHLSGLPPVGMDGYTTPTRP